MRKISQFLQRIAFARKDYLNRNTHQMYNLGDLIKVDLGIHKHPRWRVGVYQSSISDILCLCYFKDTKRTETININKLHAQRHH